MLMRFDPFQELTRQAMTGTRRQPASMPMDAYRQGDQVHIYLDVPGVSGDDLDVTVEKNALTVTANRAWEPSDDMQVLAGERTQGQYSRTLQLGDNLDTEELNADYEDGVLHLTIPVADKAKPRRVEVGRKSVSASN
ncbi:MAG: Hsp20/alpha crystallin family protein [Ilumatobacter sp.]|uniref:Hsp20/alpha crystallin family protein n=1 Tax=Ilumatobacter sp. TaxID=1967498 RepID=UPI003C74624C